MNMPYHHCSKLHFLLISFLVINVPAEGVDYLKEIKPILEHKCYPCHGALKQQGELRLDTAAALIAGGESGEAVVPGKPGEGMLIDVLTGEAGFRMPPENEGSALSEEEIALIRKWITEGANAPKGEQPQTDPKAWWSYLPITRPEIPTVNNSDWCRDDFDYFVAAAREAKGLPQVAEASKEIWLRRVYLDLIGLPPTCAEQNQFLTDTSATAYERVVDDLLKRPQYGERWGRHWMDVWRYSDWYGSRGINEIRYSQRHIWRWRDWIVDSLNEDQGYDQMLVEMLAADEISDGSNASLAATGYLGRSWYKFSRDVWLFETVERTGEAFLGMTLRCCRCHDHKFDPVSQEEYYRFRAIFEPHNVRTDPISALTPTEKDATLGQVLKDGIALVYDQDLEVPTYRFKRGDSRFPDETKPLQPGVPAALGVVTKGNIQPEEVHLPAQMWYPMLRPELRETLLSKSEQLVVTAEKNLEDKRGEVNALANKLLAVVDASDAEPELFFHENFDAAAPDTWKKVGGTWTYQDGKLVQSAVTSFATMVTKQDHPGDFKVHLRYRPLSPGTYRSIGFSFDYQDQGNSQDIYTSTGDTRQSVQAFHRVSGKQVYPQLGIVKTELKVGEEAVLEVTVLGSSLTIELNGEHKLTYDMPVERKQGKFALWVHQGAAEFLELKMMKLAESRETLEAQKKNAERVFSLAKAELQATFGEAESTRQRITADVAKYLGDNEKETKELAKKASAAEFSAAMLRAEVDVLKAGDGKDKLAKATKILDAAREAAKAPAGSYTPVGEQYPQTSTGRRTALANWLINSQNPRTARVAVNHIWGRHFSQLIVATPENFGLNGRTPTHPKLLDWLAAELIATNWKMKPFHKRIVLSATYRMSSEPNFGETTNNSTLKELVRKLDPENVFLWRMNSRRMEAEVVRDSVLQTASRLDFTMGGPELLQTTGEKTLRRSLYFRNTPNEKMEMLSVFDMADPNACYRRKESVIPHQSLALMNSGLALDSARIVAQQLAEESEFVTAAFQTVLARMPTDSEIARCEKFLHEHAELLKKDSTEKFPKGGTAKRTVATDSVIRAKENLVHVLFLHNDFVTIR